MFDHMRGSQLETEVYDLPSDRTLDLFVTAMNGQLDRLGQAEADESERREVARAERLASSIVGAQQGAGRTSIADELAKLASLNEQGVLSNDEFASQKAKLLA